MRLADVKRFVGFIGDRETARVNRAAGKPPPWTPNKLIQEWKFTNVRREDDRVTRWIATNWRTPHSGDPDMWFAMAVARLINWPDTLADMGWPVPYRAARAKAVIAKRMAAKKQTWGGAYIITTGGRSGAKEDFVFDEVLHHLWQSREEMRPRSGDTLRTFFDRLRHALGFGSFMAGQVIADVKHDQKSPLSRAPDWWTFACPGPGSKRGLNRVYGREVDAPWSDTEWMVALGRLHARLNDAFREVAVMELHAQDLQNCLCEFDKIERIRLGEGRPKARFKPSDEALP